MGKNDEDLLTSRLAPKRREELQIHNKKLGELSHWLLGAFDERPPALFLTGPTGSGKSTAVEVLCKEQKIEVIDYTPELLHDDQLEFEQPDSSQLIRFLVRRHASFQGSSRKRLLLVTELPDQAYYDAEQFRQSLSEVLPNLWHPVIFCLSNEIASWNLNPNRLFTEHFLQKNAITLLSFNPVAETFMKKALVRASNLLMQPLSQAKLNVIGEEARGDLRAAMNMLQMNTAGPDADRRGGTKIICASKANKEEAFYMLGRILHAKRVNPNAPKPLRPGQKKRSSVIPEPKERTELEHDPTDIIAMSSMSSEKLVSFLFENEPVFCTNIVNYRHVADTFSLCDAITGDWNTCRSYPEEYVSQMATRSVMWYNYKCERPRSFYSVRRPAMKDLYREIETVQNEIRRLPTVGVRHFSMLTAPYTTLINGVLDPCRIDCVVARPMSISWKFGRDQIEEQMERKAAFRRSKRKKEDPVKQKNEEQVESEEEKFTIEDSSDDEDSFDDF